jgi:hypothetical protein
MCRYLAMVGLLALIAQGCTKKPESYPLTSFRVDYRLGIANNSRTKPVSSKTRLRWLPSSAQVILRRT